MSISPEKSPTKATIPPTKLASLQAERDKLLATFKQEVANKSSQRPERTTDNPQTGHIDGEPNAEAAKQTLQQANDIVKAHIKLLNSYNEIRDVGMMLLRLIADERGVLLREVMEEFDVSSKD